MQRDDAAGHDAITDAAEARRVLKPGGLALFMDTVAPDQPLADTWLQTIELIRDPSHVRNYRRSEWHALLAGAGFTVGASHSSRLRLEFASWVARIGTPAPRVTALRCLHALAPAEVAAALALEPDGSFTIEKAMIEAE